MASGFIGTMSRRMPLLPLKLRQAGLTDSPEEFLRKSFIMALYGSIALAVVVALIGGAFGMDIILAFFLWPLLFIMIFGYAVKIPEVYTARRRKDIEKEIVFMGRYLILELEAGIPVYNAMKNISKSYEHIGKYFKEILDKVDTGTPMEDALNEAIMISPSPSVVRILWQILNSLKTGSDVTISLVNVLDQITREQIIQIKEYGKKLNPMAMMYMVIAIIFPSLGVTIFLVISSFFSLNVTFSWLFAMSVFIGIMQFMFYSMIKSQRPAVEL
ncbi:type II secretion system F family protein [Candidatus Woesearchaeota archaeon]|nr:type II secretion system F family protein [Candidatus Woesearchaeota archaeon]